MFQYSVGLKAVSSLKSVFKIRSETCWTEAQFSPNFYMIKKESLLDRTGIYFENCKMRIPPFGKMVLMLKWGPGDSFIVIVEMLTSGKMVCILTWDPEPESTKPNEGFTSAV